MVGVALRLPLEDSTESTVAMITLAMAP
jgi:hypothetical protein